jgi:hypothetical protein
MTARYSDGPVNAGRRRDARRRSRVPSAPVQPRTPSRHLPAVDGVVLPG